MVYWVYDRCDFVRSLFGLLDFRFLFLHFKFTVATTTDLKGLVMEDEAIERAKRETEFYREQLARQTADHKEQLARQKEASKFYNTDGFWIAFWILIPFVLVALGISL